MLSQLGVNSLNSRRRAVGWPGHEEVPSLIVKCKVGLIVVAGNGVVALELTYFHLNRRLVVFVDVHSLRRHRETFVDHHVAQAESQCVHPLLEVVVSVRVGHIGCARGVLTVPWLCGVVGLQVLRSWRVK